MSSLTPSASRVESRRRLTITGTGLRRIRSVTFGGVPGTAITFVSSRTLQVTAPALPSAGTVDVVVTTRAGASRPVPFTVRPRPAITAISPKAGPTTGGSGLTLVGEGLADTTSVTLGDIPVRELTVVSDTEIRVVTPPSPYTGVTRVRVQTADGRGASRGRFRYVKPPVVTAVRPSTGTPEGGTLLTIEGTGLLGATSVLVGGLPATVVSVNPLKVRAISPARADVGPAPVTVTTAGGPSAPADGARFTYVLVPVITSVSPATGATAGGQSITLRGEHLRGATEVTFDGAPGTDLRVLSDTELSVVTPPRTTAAEVDVRVTTPSGTSERAAAQFRFAFDRDEVARPVSEGGLLGTWLPLGIIGVLSWSVWFVRRFLSRHRYEPVVNDHRTSTSVVIPVYREDPDVLERCLRTWLREDPSEVILVVDDRDLDVLDRLERLALPRVRVLRWRHSGKRGALGAGVREARGEVVVFADSDTQWRPGLLAAVQMPFADPRVGGVGTRQHVYLPDTHLWRRVAYWMLNTRYLDYVPAMSRRGGVACLSGRTAAYRRSVIRPLMPALEHEVFLGRECVAGDDGRLTWLVLAAGYRTVHQDTAEADSMFPDELRAFVRQRVRWSRNSYRCYLTAVAQGWLWQRPLITQVTVLQILLTPVSMGATVWYGAQWISRGGLLALAVVLLWAVVGRALRATSHLLERPRDLVLAPVMAVVIVTIALPIKLVAAATMNKQGWLTRLEGERVRGQGEIEVRRAGAS